MTTLERIARAALADDTLAARSLVQDWLRLTPVVANLSAPTSDTDATVTSLTAGLAELMADRLGQPSPSWAAAIGPAAEPVYLVRAAERMRRLRAMCEAESPLPLRRRRFYAPADYLTAV